MLVLAGKKVSSLAVKIEKRRPWRGVEKKVLGNNIRQINAYRFDGVSLQVKCVDDFSVLRGLLLLGYECSSSHPFG